MINLLFCTHNRNKWIEIKSLLPNYFNVLSLRDLNFTQTIEETGKTLEENSFLKASKIYEIYQKPCFSDDSGLEVDSLNGQPGVLSARFSGPESDDQKNMQKLLKLLENSKNRKASFRTVITYINGIECIQFEGRIKGEISRIMAGRNGFGYDPIFMPEGSKKTFAQMSLEEKNSFSHRSIAFNKFKNYLINNSC